MQGTLVAPVHLPPVAYEHAGVVGAQHGGRIVEPAAGADGVDGGVRGNERPQPEGLRVDAPARFIRRDYRRAADLPAEFVVDRRGVPGDSMQQTDEATGGDLHAEPRPQQAGDLGQRHAHLGVQLDDERGEPGAELHRSRPEGVGYLEAVAALHAPPAPRTAADLDVEAAHDGADSGELFLILRGYAGHLDGTTAVGTRRRHRRPVGLVDPRRAASRTLSPVLRPGPSAGRLAGPLRPVLGEGCSLPFGGAAGLIELLLEVLATSLPAVSVAGGARQVLVQLRDLPLEFLDALVPRIVLSPGRLRTAASAALAGHAPRIGTCTRKLHTTSRIFSTLPGNRRPPAFPPIWLEARRPAVRLRLPSHPSCKTWLPRQESEWSRSSSSTIILLMYSLVMRPATNFNRASTIPPSCKFMALV